MSNLVREKVLADIISGIEKEGHLPWDCGYVKGLHTFPYNLISDKEYKGFNRLMLLLYGKGLAFATFKQISENGGKVKKGSKGLKIIFYSPYDTKEKKIVPSYDYSENVIPLLKSFTVFNIENQTEGIELKAKLSDNEKRADIEDVIKVYCKKSQLAIEIDNSTECACYIPSKHIIKIRDINHYKNESHYYSTLLHELIHSTMKDLKRDGAHRFGTYDYSKEEIVAEVGSMFLCQYFGITKVVDNSVTYIKGWSQKLKENPNWLFEGANQAEKAYQYILG